MPNSALSNTPPILPAKLRGRNKPSHTPFESSNKSHGHLHSTSPPDNRPTNSIPLPLSLRPLLINQLNLILIPRNKLGAKHLWRRQRPSLIRINVDGLTVRWHNVEGPEDPCEGDEERILGEM
jgi:hypothetical protein